MGGRDEKVVLGDSHRDASDVTLLKGVGANVGRRYLTSDDDERRGVHVGVSDRGDDVGRSRSAGHHGDSRSPRGHGVTLSHVTGPLFVTNEDVTD